MIIARGDKGRAIIDSLLKGGATEGAAKPRAGQLSNRAGGDGGGVRFVGDVTNLAAWRPRGPCRG